MTDKKPAKQPVKTAAAAAADLMHDWVEALVVTEAASLSVLQAEMEGLAVLFGGEAAPKTEAEAREAEAKTEDGFDNMPV